MWGVRFRDGRWSDPFAVTRDGWKIDGCPVNGPALDARGERVALAWFTAPGDAGRVSVAFELGDGAFGSPLQVDLGRPLGRVDVAWLDDDSVLVSWLEQHDGAARVLARRVTAAGAAAPALVVAPTSTARSSGFPRLTRHGRSVLAAWTESGTPSRVRVALLGAVPGPAGRTTRFIHNINNLRVRGLHQSPARESRLRGGPQEGTSQTVLRALVSRPATCSSAVGLASAVAWAVTVAAASPPIARARLNGLFIVLSP
jgi:hypothetical protein